MKIKIHYSIFILLILVLYTRLYIEFLIFMSSIILHELGHIISSIFFKCKITNLTITFIGGVSYIDTSKLIGIKSIIISLSGILINLIIILICYYFNLFNDYRTVIINYNKLLIIFNLLPIFPLDGYRVLDEIIDSCCVSLKARKRVIKLSLFFCILLLIFSFFMKSFGLIIIDVFLLIKNIDLWIKKDNVALKKFLRKNYKNEYIYN